MKKFLFFALIAALVPAAHAQVQKPSPATEWYRAGHVTLRLTDAARDFTARWQFDRADNGDNRVIREERRGAVDVSGTVMTICDDRALVMKNLKPERKHEMGEIDEPVLNLQLVLRLLARAAPEGPVAMGGEKLVELNEPAAVIRVRKGLEARRDFNAPWQARGRIKREASGDIGYEIVFSYAGADAKAPRSELTLAGVWRQLSGAQSFADATDIADWLVFRVNPVAVTTGGNTQFESMSTTTPLHYATLGNLRRHIERSWSANPKMAPNMECKP